MTIPSTFKVSPVDTGVSNPVQKIGGVAIGITSATDVTAGQPITKVFDIKSQGLDGVTRRSIVVDTDSTQKAYSSGTFAYDQVAFMIRTVTTTISGVANNVLLFNGNDDRYVKNNASIKAIGAKTMTAMRARYWQPLGISGQRTNWSTAPSALATTYIDPTTGSATSRDQAIDITRAIPGELVYLVQSGQPKQDDYKARTGG